MPDLSALEELQTFDAYHVPALAVIYILDISSAVVLNILMIVAGVGLMGLKERARRLAIRVAQLKILRWIASDAHADDRRRADDPGTNPEGHVST